MRAAGHALRRVVLGEAGPAPAWVLAGVAMVIAFIVVAGPRALVSADNRATRQAVAQAPALDDGALITADLTATPAVGHQAAGLSAAAIGALARAFAARLPLARLFPPGEHWGGAVLPSEEVIRPPSPDGKSQFVELAYRSALANNAKVVAGALPAGAAVLKAGAGGRPGSVTLKIAATRATAGTFGWHVGSVIDLGEARAGAPVIFLRVTGIIQPGRPRLVVLALRPGTHRAAARRTSHESALAGRRVRRSWRARGPGCGLCGAGRAGLLVLPDDHGPDRRRRSPAGVRHGRAGHLGDHPARRSRGPRRLPAGHGDHNRAWLTASRPSRRSGRAPPAPTLC